MARLRKFSAYQNLERPYTRISKYTKQNFVRGGYPHKKIVRYNMGTEKKYDILIQLNAGRSMNIRQEALESARVVSNRYLEKTLGKNFYLRLKVYPFHVLRENPLASGAGADRMSTGMKMSYGKTIGCAARIKEGQTIFELRLDKANTNTGREALNRSATKLPCTCKIIVSQ